MSDKNKVDLKSVSGGQGQPSTGSNNVNKAKQIVKEELKKESLSLGQGSSSGEHGAGWPG